MCHIDAVGCRVVVQKTPVTGLGIVCAGRQPAIAVNTVGIDLDDEGQLMSQVFQSTLRLALPLFRSTR